MWLAAELWYSDGRVKRYGPDEEDVRDLVSGIEWSTQIPGGYDTGSLVLPRLPDIRADERKLFSHVRIYGPGNQTYYEGRITGTPQVGVEEIHLETEGWVASLGDNEYFERLYVDSDLGAWQEPSTTRQLALIAAGSMHLPGGGLRTDKLATALNDIWAAARRNEQWYRGRLPIGGVWYRATDGVAGGFAATLAGAQTVVLDIVTSESNTVGAVSTGDLSAGLPATGTLANTTPTFTTAYVRATSAAAGAAGNDYPILWELAVLGNHGLPTTAISTGAPALRASDIVADCVGLAAPSLTFTTGPSGSIETSQALINQAVYHATTGRAVIEEMTLRGASYSFLPDWGVYDGRQFFWRTPGSYGRQWHVSREDVTPTYSGPDVGEQVKAVVVTYDDTGGVKHSVGGTGTGADVENSLLSAVSSTSPRIKVVDIGISFVEAATVIGQLVLSEQNQLIRRGSISFTGEAKDITGAPYPVAAIRAGDRVSIKEDLGPPVVISNTTYSQDTLTLSADLGAPSHSSEALFAQLAA